VRTSQSKHLITPTGDAGPVGAQIEKALRDSLQKDIHLEQVADPDMIGGAVLVIGDELYDISIPGALEHLREYLKHSSFGQQSDSPQS
jgi:F-type H+-transporting ATPase subunit alpha